MIIELLLLYTSFHECEIVAKSKNIKNNIISKKKKFYLGEQPTLLDSMHIKSPLIHIEYY